MVPTMLAAPGVPIKVIYGYVSTARVLLALEQGEIDGVFTVEEFVRAPAGPDHEQDRASRSCRTSRRLPGLPLVRDVLPKSEAPLLTLVLALENFGLPVVGPAGIAARARRYPAHGVSRDVRRQGLSGRSAPRSTSRSARRSTARSSPP